MKHPSNKGRHQQKTCAKNTSEDQKSKDNLNAIFFCQTLATPGADNLQGKLSAIWGCLKTPISIKWCFHVLSFFFSSYRSSKCWLHTLMKQFILCFLCGISPYNHQWTTSFTSVFRGKACICKVGMMRSATGATGATGARGAAGGTAGYIMYMYEHRYRFFFPLIVFSSENYIWLMGDHCILNE